MLRYVQSVHPWNQLLLMVIVQLQYMGQLLMFMIVLLQEGDRTPKFLSNHYFCDCNPLIKEIKKTCATTVDEEKRERASTVV